MPKKRRNSILRRPDSATGGPPTETVIASIASEKRSKTKVSIESEKENQASASGTDSDSGGPVTRKHAKNRRVSFGAHIACKDMDTGRITNLKIPHPSFNSSASLAIANGSMGSGSSQNSASVPAQFQEMEMSMDDSMGMNRTTVGQDSSDSMALSESSGDGMDMSLMSLPAADSKQTYPLGTSLLSEPGNVAPRKSLLPFACNDGIDAGLDDTNDSLISTTSAICPPGLTGKINFQAAKKKSTVEDELDSLDNQEGYDAGFLAAMRRISRGKVVANRKTALDSDTISNIVDVINGDDGADNSLDMDADDDDMDMEDSVRGIFEMIDGVKPAKELGLDIGDAEEGEQEGEVMQMTLGKSLIGSATVRGSSGLTTVSAVMMTTTRDMSMTKIPNDSSLSLEDESTLGPMSVIQPTSAPTQPPAAAQVENIVTHSSSFMNEDDSLQSGNATLTDQTATGEAMEMTTVTQSKSSSINMNKTTASKSDMDFTTMNKTNGPLKQTTSGMDESLGVSKSEEALFRPPALPSSNTIRDDSTDISLASETSFRRSSRLKSKPSVGDDSLFDRTSEVSPSQKSHFSAVPSVTLQPANSVNTSISQVDLSINRSTRSKKKNCNNTLVSGVLEESVSLTINKSTKKLDSTASDTSSATGKSGKSSAGTFRKTKSKATSGNSTLVSTEDQAPVKEFVQSMSEVSLIEDPPVSLPTPCSKNPAVLMASNEPEIAIDKSVAAASGSNASNCLLLMQSSATSQQTESQQLLETSQSSLVPQKANQSSSDCSKRSQSPSIPSGAFWLNPQPSASVTYQPSPQKKNMSAGIIDEEMPLMTLMTFDVGGANFESQDCASRNEAEDHPLETSMAVIQDLSSLAALSFVDPKESLNNLLSQCCIDVKATDKKWNEVVVPLFERVSSSPETTISVPSEDDDADFKEALLRGHLGEARHLSISLAFNDFKDNYFVKVARLNCLIDKIQNESGETPGFLHEWLDGDEESKRSVERRVKRMFKLYESKDYKNKLNYLTKFDQTFLEHIEAEKTTVRKQLRDLRSVNSSVESLLEDAREIAQSQEEEIIKRQNAAKETEDSLAESKTKLQRLEASKREEEEAAKKRKESDSELKKLTKDKEEEWKEKQARRKFIAATKDKIAVIKNKLTRYDSRDSHPWKLENFHLGAGGFIFFRFPRWKFTFDVSLGAATPSADSPASSSVGFAFDVASTRLACAGVKRASAMTLDGAEFSFRDLDTKLPLLLHQKNYGEESQRMWTFVDLKSRLTDIVALLDSCRKLIELYDEIISLKVDQRRKDWFQMPGLAIESGKLFLTIHVRRGAGGDWPLALVLKFLLTPSTETLAAGFNHPPFDNRMIISHWTDYSSQQVDLTEFRTSLLSNINIESAFNAAPADNLAYPPFHRFVRDALTETEKLLDDDYARLFGDRSECRSTFPDDFIDVF